MLKNEENINQGSQREGASPRQNNDKRSLNCKLNNLSFNFRKRIDSENFQFSDNIEEVTGYSENGINSLPGKFLSLIFPQDFESFKLEYFEFLGNKPESNLYLEYRIVTKDKSIFWVSNTISIERDTSNNPIGIAGFVFRIDELKAKEISLANRIEELVKTNRSKDNFFSIMSHDLRSPFTSIIGFSEILLNEPNISESERTEFLKYIYDSAQLQLKLINNLLDWSRIELGKVKAENKRISAKYALHNSISALTGEAVRKNIEIIAHIEPHLFIKADETLLGKVIFNLLENAIKYSNKNSQVDIIARCFNKEKVELIFKDKGIGISQENINNIFQLEKKYNTPGTNGEKGTGTGLVLAKKILKLLKAEIWFYSTKDVGTEFHVILPQATDTVFIVEEDEVEKLLLINFFKKEYPNFNIQAFSGGYDAIIHAESISPILVLVNNNLTLLNGIDFIKEFKQIKNNQKALFLPIFNEQYTEKKNEYKELGIKLFLNKPFNDKELNIKVKQLTG